MAILNFRRFYKAESARIAAWLPATETWDTSVDVPNLQGIKLEPESDEDTMPVYGVNEHGLSVFKGGKVELDFGGIDRTVSNIMTGLTSTSAGSGASETRTTRHKGGVNNPYFALCVQIPADDGGDVHLLLPKLQLSGRMAMEIAKESKFIVPNLSAQILRLRKANGDLYPLYDEVEHAAMTTLEPDFATAFTVLS